VAAAAIPTVRDTTIKKLNIYNKEEEEEVEGEKR